MSLNTQRRSFFRHATAAAITSGFLVPTIARSEPVQSDCSLTVSLADSLITFVGLLARIESLAMNGLHKTFNEKYQAFSSAYNNVHVIAQNLRKQICPPTVDAQIEQICALAAAGAQSAQAGDRSSLQVSGALNDQIGKIAECIPQADKMSSAAMDLLQRLLREVEVVRKRQCESDIANNDVRKRRAELEKNTSEIRTLLHKSVSGLSRFEAARSERQKPAISAELLETLNKCIDKLGELRPKVGEPPLSRTFDEDSSVATLELLALLLVGARERIKLESTSRLQNVQRREALLNHATPLPPLTDFRPLIGPVKSVLAGAACHKPSDEDALACLRSIQLIPIVGTVPDYLWFFTTLSDAAIKQGLKAALILAFKFDKTFKCYSEAGEEVTPDFAAIANGLLPIRKKIG